MNKRVGTLISFGVFLAITLTGSASALTRAKTAGGLVYATGAVTVAELRQLADERNRYDLWVTTAAKGSGAFLSDVQLKITDMNKSVVLDTTMIGPWLFINLPHGSYLIETMFRDQMQKRTTRIDSGDHHQVIMYFDSPAKVSPDWVSPFEQSPYSSN